MTFSLLDKGGWRRRNKEAERQIRTGTHDINAMTLKISAKIFKTPRAREKKGG